MMLDDFLRTGGPAAYSSCPFYSFSPLPSDKLSPPLIKHIRHPEWVSKVSFSSKRAGLRTSLQPKRWSLTAVQSHLKMSSQIWNISAWILWYWQIWREPKSHFKRVLVYVIYETTDSGVCDISELQGDCRHVRFAFEMDITRRRESRHLH